MPTTPELGNALADVGLVEVLVKPEAHHQTQADGHIGVAGKVEIQLRGVRQDAQPGIRRTGVRQRKGTVRQRRYRVGDKDFLDEALHEPERALTELFHGMGAVGELIRQVLVTQHRPGNKLGEQRNESREINKPPGRFRIPSIDIHHVGNGLEDVEGNADGQDDIRQFQRLTAGADQQVVQAVDTKVGVLEVAERRQVTTNTDGNPLAGTRGANTGAVYCQADEIVPEGHGHEQQQEIHPPPSIEGVAADQDNQ